MELPIHFVLEEGRPNCGAINKGVNVKVPNCLAIFHYNDPIVFIAYWNFEPFLCRPSI